MALALAIEQARAEALLERLWRVAVPSLTALFGYLPGGAGLGTDLPAFFRRRFADALWPGLYDLLARALAGERVLVARPSSPLRPTIDDIMADLSFGRP